MTEAERLFLMLEPVVPHSSLSTGSVGWSLCRFPTVPGSVHPGSPHERRRVVRERSESEGVRPQG